MTLILIIIALILLFYLRNLIATALTIAILVYAVEHYIPGFWENLLGY